MKILRSLQNVRLELVYSTRNRGDCETNIVSAQAFEDFSELVALHFGHSDIMQRLHVELLNESQRKRGPKTLRAEAVYEAMYKILLPFAELPARQQVTVGGFDTIDFVEIFEEMRQFHKDTDPSEGLIEKHGARSRFFD